MASDDPFAAGARLKEASRHNYLFAWRRHLGFLAIHDPAALELAPAERLTTDRVRLLVAHLAETNTPRSVAGSIDALYQAARLMMPEQDWTWLRMIKKQLYRHAPPSGASGPVITSVQLWELGERLMEEVKPRPESPITMKDAIQYRDGLIIALGAFIPIRRRNVIMEIGRHLIRDGDRWLIIIPAEESKTKIAMSYLVPECLEGYLAVYLDVVRPTLLRDPGCLALWASAKGGGICYGAIGEIASRRLTSYFDFRVTLHDVRDADLTAWAIFAPDQIGVASELLGHRDQRSDKHYNRARGIQASRTYSRLIAGIRKNQKWRGR
jgi:hypothetical protein